MCHFDSHKVTPRRQQSATSTTTKCHIDGQQVPSPSPRSATCAKRPNTYLNLPQTPMHKGIATR